jgi:hypothetical protein
MSNSNRASLAEMDLLHAQVASTLKSALDMQYTDDDGKPAPPPAAILTVAVNFLKANGITGVAPTQNTALSFLNEASLPFLENAIRDATSQSLN